MTDMKLKGQINKELIRIAEQLKHLASSGWHNDMTARNTITKAIDDLTEIRARLQRSGKP